MKYSLRSLMIVVLVLPPLLATIYLIVGRRSVPVPPEYLRIESPSARRADAVIETRRQLELLERETP